MSMKNSFKNEEIQKNLKLAISNWKFKKSVRNEFVFTSFHNKNARYHPRKYLHYHRL